MMANRKYFLKEILKSGKSLKLGELNYTISKEIPKSKWMDRGKKSVVTVSTTQNLSENTFKRKTRRVLFVQKLYMIIINMCMGSTILINYLNVIIYPGSRDDGG